MASRVKRSITITRNYRLFHLSSENRNLDLKKHRKLYESMRRYGFLACFPLACVRDPSGNLVVKDGQHRLAIAEELGLPVPYVESPEDFDVSFVNSAAKGWTVRDYADKFAAQGLSDYQDAIDFSENFHLPIGIAAALLGGYTSFCNVQRQFIDGKFRIKEGEWAGKVATLYVAMVSLSAALRNARFLEACMAVCRVPEFDSTRLIRGGERCREKLVSYSTRDAYLEMIEVVYNFGRKTLIPVKLAAIQAMRDRSASNVKQMEKQERERRSLLGDGTCEPA